MSARNDYVILWQTRQLTAMGAQEDILRAMDEIDRLRSLSNIDGEAHVGPRRHGTYALCEVNGVCESFPTCPCAIPDPPAMDSLRAEVVALEVECQLQRNLLGNATGAALDVGLAGGLAGGVAAHDAIYLLAAERDVLRLALVKWKRSWGASDVDSLRSDTELAAAIPDDLWGLGVTGGGPR